MLKRNKRDLIGSISSVAGVSLAIYTVIRHGKAMYVFLLTSNLMGIISFFIDVGLIVLCVYLLIRLRTTEETVITLEKKIEPMAKHIEETAKSLKVIERILIEKALTK